MPSNLSVLAMPEKQRLAVPTVDGGGFSAMEQALRTGGSRFVVLEDGEWHTPEGPELANELAEVRQRLVRWGISAGTRVGILAGTSLPWIVHDLAVSMLGAVSVVFPESGDRDYEALAAKYDLALMLISREEVDPSGLDRRAIRRAYQKQISGTRVGVNSTNRCQDRAATCK